MLTHSHATEVEWLDFASTYSDCVASGGALMRRKVSDEDKAMIIDPYRNVRSTKTPAPLLALRVETHLMMSIYYNVY